MDLRTATKLQQLRKKQGLSQEDLACQLKVSRQAVSKWERGEASPDTDNLICLAKLYNISLDELLEIEQNYDTEYKNNSTPRANKFNEENVKNTEEIEEEEDNPTSNIGKLFYAITPLISIIAFCLLGGIWNLWHPAWIVFFSIPIISSLIAAIEKKKFTIFAYPIFIVAIYLCLGCILKIWHPTWVIFLTIPLYYVIFKFIDKKPSKKH